MQVDLNPIELANIPGAVQVVQEYAEYALSDYAAFIKELSIHGVALSDDPGSVPLNQLNAQIAKVDAQKTRTATIFSQAITNEDGLNVLAKKISAIFKSEFDSRLPQSPVKDFSNKELREGACNSLLANLKEVARDIDGSLSQAKTFTKVVQNELNKLDGTNKNISRQITVLQIQIDIGEIRRTGQTGGSAPRNVDGGSYTFNDDNETF